MRRDSYSIRIDEASYWLLVSSMRLERVVKKLQEAGAELGSAPIRCPRLGREHMPRNLIVGAKMAVLGQWLLITSGR